MSTQLQLLTKKENPMALLNLGIELIRLSYEYNEVEEIDQIAIERELDQLVNQICRKFDDTVFLIKSLESQAQYFKDLANRLQKKAQSAMNAIDRLTTYLIEVGTLDPRLLQGKIFKGSIYTRKSVEVVEIDAIPEKYKLEKIEIKPDKKLILGDLEAGEIIKGARLLEKNHLRIS